MTRRDRTIVATDDDYYGIPRRYVSVRQNTVVTEYPSGGSKADWRRRVRARRRAAGADVGSRDTYAAQVVLHDPRVMEALQPDCSVAVYVALPHEPPTLTLRRHLRDSGVAVFVPWTRPDRRLLWVPDRGNARAWGVPGQPEAPSGETGQDIDELADLRVLVIPALAATPTGERLGQGGGYYDTVLARVTPHAEGGPLRVALVGTGEVFDDLPTEAHDARVDVVLTV